MFLKLFLLLICIYQARGQQGVTDVHIIFSSHLDVGYTDTAINVINLHFNTYYPAAAKTAQELRMRGGEERLIYMTHAWLIDLYFDCENANIPREIKCPSSAEKEVVFKAIQQGDIVYQAYLFNGQNELLEPSLFRSGLKVSRNLDKFFNKTQGTITMSQRDVPGITRSVIPHLVAEGVLALSVGVNSGSAPPAVPKIFVWQEKNSKESIIAMWHPGGYGGIGVSDCAIVPQIGQALAFAWRGDNGGPPGVDEVLSNFATVRKEFPGAKVKASTFDEFVRLVLPVKDSLPVVTQEIGDTWIIFQAADSLKQTYFREIQRARAECIQAGKCDPEQEDFKRFDRLLIKISEHTGSADDTRYLNDYSNWSNEQFNKVKNNNNFKFMVSTFEEQREYIDHAVELLKPSPFVQELKSRLEALTPRVPSIEGFTPVSNLSDIFTINGVSLGFSKSGGISHLVDSKKRIWATATNTIAEYSYITLSDEDYTTWLKAYSYCSDIYASSCSWVLKTHGKYNVSEANPKHIKFEPQIVNLWTKNNSASRSEFVMHLKVDPTAYITYGGAMDLWCHMTISCDEGGIISLNVTFSWWKKTSTRLPESHWFSFNPKVSAPQLWLMDKLGFPVSPLDIVTNGSHNLHGINPTSGIYYKNSDGKINLRSLDIPLVSPGEPNALSAPFVVPNIEKGWHYLLTANIWGTNWPAWYPFLESDGNSQFRFEVTLAP